MRTSKKEESSQACGDGGRSTLRWSHSDQGILKLEQSSPQSQIFRQWRVPSQPDRDSPFRNCNYDQDLQRLEARVSLFGLNEGLRIRPSFFFGMAGGLHLFTATNRVSRPDAGEILRLEIGAKLQGSEGLDGGRRSEECGRGCGVMSLVRAAREFDRVTLPGKQGVRRFVAATMAGSCTDAPSCIFVGPIETAEKARLEALYQQARDSYYSGQPLVVDDMFDKVEMQLRWHGSKLVLKYPRCSLKRFTAYADAEVDPSQMRALKSIWTLIFAAGVSLAVGLPTLVSAYMEFTPHEPGTFVMSDTNRMFLSVFSFLVGAPVAQAAVKQLQALGRGDLVALKGCCPNCGEEVYTFVKPDHSSLKVRHESECHICERQLVFQATLHPSKSGLGQPWAHGRVYLQTRVNQLAPSRRAS